MIGLIADDLTGASDSAVQFARRGWETLLLLSGGVAKDSRSFLSSADARTCLAMTTDARALDAVTAERRTAEAVSELIEVGADRIFLKIDSTLRGSVSAQIRGALIAWRTKYEGAFAVVCPAYPKMGRVVHENRLSIHGAPVEQTPFGHDPVTPVTTSDLAELIPGSCHVQEQQIWGFAGEIVTVDATSDYDLSAIARSITAAGPSVIPVGSGGLACELAAAAANVPSERDCSVQFDNPRILILVTSLNPVSHTQIAALARAFPHVEVFLPPLDRVGNTSVADSLAAAFCARVAQEPWDVIGLIGGDGARAALRSLEASAIRILDAPVEGVPFGTIVGGRADGIAVFTKAGGFGAADALVRLVQQITA